MTLPLHLSRSHLLSPRLPVASATPLTPPPNSRSAAKKTQTRIKKIALMMRMKRKEEAILVAPRTMHCLMIATVALATVSTTQEMFSSLVYVLHVHVYFCFNNFFIAVLLFFILPFILQVLNLNVITLK